MDPSLAPADGESPGNPPASSELNALDVIVGMLPALDDEFGATGTTLYDRLCEAICRLASLQRAGLLLYDEARRMVVPSGSHGIDSGLLTQIYGTLEETPMAQVALAEDRVVEATEGLADLLPPRYADLSGITTLVCTPVSASGRWLGVVFADRGGEPFTLTEEERRVMYAFGKAAALAAGSRLGTVQQARARVLAARLDLARELHERVVQRLFGVSLVLGSEHELSKRERDRCASEIEAALSDMRTALSRPVTAPPRDLGLSLREELERLRGHYRSLPLEVEWEEGCEVPPGCEALSQSILAEALRNCEKHARPSCVRVSVASADGAFSLEVHNDGAGSAPGVGNSSRMGLHLAALEAIQKGGMVEFGPLGDDEWRLRLVLPEAAVAESGV